MSVTSDYHHFLSLLVSSFSWHGLTLGQQLYMYSSFIVYMERVMEKKGMFRMEFWMENLNGYF